MREGARDSAGAMGEGEQVLGIHALAHTVGQAARNKWRLTKRGPGAETPIDSGSQQKPTPPYLAHARSRLSKQEKEEEGGGGERRWGDWVEDLRKRRRVRDRNGGFAQRMRKDRATETGDGP